MILGTISPKCFQKQLYLLGLCLQEELVGIKISYNLKCWEDLE